MIHPEVNYASSGDLSIAYAQYGEGPIDIVLVPGFVTHLDLMWDLPYAKHFEAWGEFARVQSRAREARWWGVRRIAAPRCGGLGSVGEDTARRCEPTYRGVTSAASPGVGLCAD